MINISCIEKAEKSTTLNDVKSAEAVLDYAKAHGYDEHQAAAMCLRAGIHTGNVFGKKRAKEAFDLLHEYQGREDKKNLPEKRIKDAAQWIHDAKLLRELAAFLEGRAAAVESGMAAFPDDEYTRVDGEPANAFIRDNDVNSDGTEEV